MAPPGGRIWCKPDALIERMSEVASRNLLPSHSPLSLRCWLCKPPNPLPKTKNGRTCNALITLGNPECKTPPARQRQPYPKCEMNLPRIPTPGLLLLYWLDASRRAPKLETLKLKWHLTNFLGGPHLSTYVNFSALSPRYPYYHLCMMFVCTMYVCVCKALAGRACLWKLLYHLI